MYVYLMLSLIHMTLSISSLGMDCSELCMPVLEQSFQPMIDTVLQNTENMEMGPTPRPVKKKQKRKQDIQVSCHLLHILSIRNSPPTVTMLNL